MNELIITPLLQEWEQIQKEKKGLSEREKTLREELEKFVKRNGGKLIIESATLQHKKYGLSIKERRTEAITKEGRLFLKEHHPEFVVVKETSYLEVRRLLK